MLDPVDRFADARCLVVAEELGSSTRESGNSSSCFSELLFPLPCGEGGSNEQS